MPYIYDNHPKIKELLQKINSIPEEEWKFDVGSGNFVYKNAYFDKPYYACFETPGTFPYIIVYLKTSESNKAAILEIHKMEEPTVYKKLESVYKKFMVKEDEEKLKKERMTHIDKNRELAIENFLGD